MGLHLDNVTATRETGRIGPYAGLHYANRASDTTNPPILFDSEIGAIHSR